jgi:putative DNA primase/helicase
VNNWQTTYNDGIEDELDDPPRRQPNGHHEPELVKYHSRCMADVKAEKIDWLWHQRIARGKLTLLGGHPGGGKSQLSILAAARVTTGTDWPDGAHRPKASVVIVSCEDSAADTIVPRLEAAGADKRLVHTLDWVEHEGKRRLFDIARDIPVLEAMVRKLGDVGLIIIDPITAYLGKIDSYNNAEVRAGLAPLQDMAENSNAAYYG